MAKIKLCYNDCCPTLEPLTEKRTEELGFYDDDDPLAQSKVVDGWFVIEDDLGNAVVLHEEHIEFLQNLKELPTTDKPVDIA